MVIVRTQAVTTPRKKARAISFDDRPPRWSLNFLSLVPKNQNAAVRGKAIPKILVIPGD